MNTKQWGFYNLKILLNYVKNSVNNVIIQKYTVKTRKIHANDSANVCGIVCFLNFYYHYKTNH